MANNSPTIVVGSLNDDELKKSIDKLVANVDEGLNKMLQSTKNAVSEMNKTLKSLGDTKVDFGGSSDGGSSKRAKAQNAETDAIEKSISARQKQIRQNKDVEMSFDQIANALSRARQTVRDFNIGRQDGLPSSEDYRRYEQALAKIVEYNDKLKQSALGRAFANEQAFAFDARRAVAINPMDERLKQLNQYYAQEEKLSQRANQKRLDAIAKESSEQKRLIDEQYKLAFARTNKIPTDQIDLAQAKLERLQALLRDMRDRGILSNTQIASTESEIRKLEQLIAGSAQQQQQLNQSASRYTEEVRKQAQAIRESQQWKEKGFVVVGDASYYDPERANMSKRQKEQLLTLEEQILAQTKQREDAERRAAAATREEAEALKVAANGFKILNSSERQKGIGVYSQSAAKVSGTEDYMGMLQRVLGLQQHEIQNVNEENDSYRRLAAQLKQLGTAYDRLTASERNSDNGKQLVGSMLEIRRAMQEIQRQKSRPVRLEDVLAFQPKNLDQMADKIRELQAYIQGVEIKNSKGIINPQATENIRKASEEIKKIQKDMDGYMGKVKGVIEGNNALTRSFNYMKNRLAFYFTVGAATGFVKSLIDIRGQYELLERSIGILIDSAQQGSKIFSELNAMAIKSPFTTMELGAAAKQLVAYDVAAKDVVDTTRRLADMAAAVGIPIERLTYALGQIKAYGYLNARDARMFANAGIPLVKELADRYTELEGRLVSTSDVYDRIKKKAISYEDVMATVNKMTDEGGKFFNFQEKAADTLVVKLANLRLAYNNMMNELGKQNTGVINASLAGVKTMFEHWHDIDAAIWGVVKILGVMKALHLVILLTMTKQTAVWKLQQLLGQKLGLMVAHLSRSLKALAVNPFTWIGAVVVALGYLYQKWDDLKEANEEFSRSMKANAEENIKSISKFFDEYKDKLKGVGSESLAEQEKIWERLREEIEKTTKNASQYVKILEAIEDIPTRVKAGEGILEQAKVIENEVKRLSERGFITLGGGFGDDSLTKDLKEYDESINLLIKDYGSLEEAYNDYKDSALGFNWLDYVGDQREAIKELQNLGKELDNVNIKKVMGTGDVESQLANIREFASIVRDNILSTEEGQKIGAEGRALLNAALDEWITKQGVANKLIKDQTFLEKEYLALEIADIEKRRSAWETFFEQLNAKDKERLKYLVDSGQISGKEFEMLWKRAAENMKENAATSYKFIQEQIADLRNTAPIVISVVYKSDTSNLDKKGQQFVKDFLTPDSIYKNDGSPILADAYQAEVSRLTEIYGRFKPKEGESNVEWEARLGKEYKSEKENVERLTSQISKLNAEKKAGKNIDQSVIDTAELEKKQSEQSVKAIKEISDARGFDLRKTSEIKKEQKAAETELAKALKEELQLIDKVRSSYKSLTDDGYNRKDAISLATEGLEESVANVNSVLSKYGLKFEVKNFAGITNPREIVDMLEEQVNRLANTAKPAEIQALQLKIKDFKIDAAKFDQKRFADSLNNELGKLNQEYELAVSLDADPEFGNMFADMFEINLDSLPRTVSEYADEYTKLLNKYLSDNKTGIELPHLYLTDDYLHAFEQMVKEEKLNAKVYEQIAAAVNNIRQKTRKDIEDTGKEWNSMIEKYGGLQAKLMNISKSSSMELRSLVKKFGSKEQIKEAIDLVDKIKISEDPQEIARLREELNKIINDITSNNTVALKVSDASNRGTDKLTSKAYWDDFKDNDELYAMTFEDMSNVSTRAINLIIDRMEALKDKVKEDPASMKTIVKNIEDAENELIGRDPFGGIVKSIRDWIIAVGEAKTARNELNIADQKVSDAEQELDKARQRGNPVDIAVAEQKLTKARDEREKINMKLTKSENKISKSQEKLRKSLQDTADVLGNIQDVFSSVSKLFRAFGDDDTADVIDSICEGFSIMTTLIFGVMAALLLLKTANPELLALAAILSVIVGLFSFLSGQKNKNIDKQVKASENRVKRLENAYKNLEYAVERAYGTAKYGAEQTALANKELQLSELKRQLYLERSRDSKHREEEKIIDLEGQIVDLENEMRKTVEDITNDLLGISGVGDAAEEMVSAMIESFKNGEDWMGKFDDTFSDMIDNMIMKAIVGRVIGDRIQGIFDLVDQKIKNRGYEEQRTLLSLQGRQKEVEERISNLKTSAAAVGRETTPYVSVYERELADIKRQIAEAEKAYEDAVRVTPSDVEEIRSITNGFRDNVKNEFQAYMDMFGITFGQDADTSKLSSLQAGIQGVTEETASALEAYMNSVSQQVYLHSELLTEIRDAIIGSDSDIGIGVQAQMLLQLQQSHQIQEAIHNILNGALTPSGRAFMVELSA